MTKEKWAMICVVAAVIVVLLIAYAFADKPDAPDVRPGERALTRRGECDSIKIGQQVTMHCEDGSDWVVVMLNPTPQPPAEQ